MAIKISNPTRIAITVWKPSRDRPTESIDIATIIVARIGLKVTRKVSRFEFAVCLSPFVSSFLYFGTFQKPIMNPIIIMTRTTGICRIIIKGIATPVSAAVVIIGGLKG